MSAQLHPDGTPCPEGTRSVPDGFVACCEAFSDRTSACYFDIRYEWWASFGEWFIVIAPAAGGGGIGLDYCPHCGTALAKETRKARRARKS